MTTEYFFDTYALIEMLEGNAAYQPYVSAQVHITTLNVFEFYYFLLRTKGEGDAKDFLRMSKSVTIDYGGDSIVEGAKVKLRNRQISMTDAIGYVTALRLGVKFLTGDKAFKGMPNVEYVR